MEECWKVDTSLGRFDFLSFFRLLLLRLFLFFSSFLSLCVCGGGGGGGGEGGEAKRIMLNKMRY